MQSRATSRLERLAAWFGVDAGWERVPTDPVRTRRTDAVIAGGFLVAGLVGIELVRGFDALGEVPGPPYLAHLAVLTGTVPLALRRRWPLAVAALLSLHMFVTGLLMPAVMVSVPMQAVYFFALFTGVAWARDRRAMLIVVTGVLLLMFGWIAWQFAVGSGVEQWLSEDGDPVEANGLLPPTASFILYTLLINVVYFGGAIVGGQAAWRAAQARERLTDQASTIRSQAVRLQQQAVVEERLRIARELHDVVAHHVSVIGIQAAAARRVLRRDPDVAEGALRSVEESSRDAVTQMRGLLGTLRAEDAADGVGPRAPEPGLADVPDLVAATTPGLTVTCEVVEDAPGAMASVPGPVGLSLYRTVQEALANVRRHSTASAATVTVRVQRAARPQFAHGYAEVEVLDDGRPLGGTSGSGLGLLGVRERLATHGGAGEIGPRATGGYRVRVRMPLGSVPREPSGPGVAGAAAGDVGAAAGDVAGSAS